MKLSLPALIATHVAAVGAGWFLAPRPVPQPFACPTGYFCVQTSRVLATTVESLRAENKLLVLSYKGSAKVETRRTLWWLFGGRQELIVPAVVNYYVDLSQLSLANVTYEERSKLVRVRLPRLTIGDIAFQPENATTTNGGVLTWREDQIEALRKQNYATARVAMVQQARQPGLLDYAQRQAIVDIQHNFEIPLRIAGQPDVKVVASFD